MSLKIVRRISCENFCLKNFKFHEFQYESLFEKEKEDDELIKPFL